MIDDTFDRPVTVPPLFQSFAIHAAILGLLFWIIYTQQQENPGTSNKPIEISDIHENTKGRIIPQHKEFSHSNSTSKATKGEHQVSLGDLGMRMNVSPEPEQKTGGYDQAPSEAATDDDWDLMNPNPRIARFNQYVYNTVQGWLDRDAYLNMQQLYGDVKMKFCFDGDGNYLEDQTHYDAIDENFKQVATRALHKSFTNPVPHPYMFTNKPFCITRMVVLRKH